MYSFILLQGERFEDPNGITMKVWVSGDSYKDANIFRKSEMSMYILA